MRGTNGGSWDWTHGKTKESKTEDVRGPDKGEKSQVIGKALGYVNSFFFSPSGTGV
jgi:hypothetical protein